MVELKVGQAYLLKSEHTPKLCAVGQVTHLFANSVSWDYWLSSGGWGSSDRGAISATIWEGAVEITQEQKDCMVSLWCPKYKSLG